MTREAVDDDTLPWPSPLRAWYAVFILTLALVLSFVDRQILSLLVEPMKRDLQLSDTEMSLLLGTAFALFYVLAGVPIGRLADRHSRRLIIGVGVFFWSLMTFGSGLVRQYWQLFLARVGVGVGEAALSPAALSLISDLFPPGRVSLPVAVFHTGSVLGAGLALLVGGTVISFTAGTETIVVPIIGTLYPWQLALLMVGAPGLVVAALLRTIREPERRELRSSSTEADEVPLREVIAYLWQGRRTYLPIFLVLAIKAFKGLGVAMWVPTLFIRAHGWSPLKVGLYQGLMLIVVAPLGMIVGGWLANVLSRRGDIAANMRVVLYGAVLVVPPSIAFPLVSSDTLAIVLYGVSLFAGSMGPPQGATGLQLISPNRMRAQVMALQFLVLNLVGFGIGPTGVALFTDFVFGDELALGASIATISAIFGVLALWFSWKTMRPYGEMLTRMRA